MPYIWRSTCVYCEGGSVINSLLLLVLFALLYAGLHSLLAARPLKVWGRFYLFSILFLWLSPVMTLNRFVFYGLATLYFYVGSIHEERRLAETFGQAYRDYQRTAPRLWLAFKAKNTMAHRCRARK